MSAVQSSSPISGGRRIDLTIDRLDAMTTALLPDQQERLAGPLWAQWSIVVTVARLRAMERAEIEAGCVGSETIADAYDRVVCTGEHAVEAMLKTFKAAYG